MLEFQQKELMSLADYLGVERSALSAEISKLQKKGVLLTKKNYFKLLGRLEDFRK